MASERDIFEDMEKRYSVAFVQDIRDRVAACEARELSYFDLKQIADLMAGYRAKGRHLLKAYRLWKAEYAASEDRIEKIYKGYEGIFLRRQLADAIRLYVTVNQDYHELKRSYLENLFQSSSYRAAAA